MSVPRTATRFAAIRLINKISIKHPKEIITVYQELEGLINDPNRSISTLAITTLLKTIGAGTIESQENTNSESIDRLITKMTSLMDEITEDFKIVIIEAIENLALKFQSKHKQLISFLNDLLKDEGSLELKSAVIDTLFDLVKFIPNKESKTSILMNLCEFIEDCEYTELCVRILHMLGDEGPQCNNPSYYIRHIYNRLVLDNSIIRSSAVIALSKFGIIEDANVRKNIKILLSRCLNDVDDEVRDRATLSLRFIENNEKSLIVNESIYDLSILETKLIHYLNDEENFNSKFNIDEVPQTSTEELKSKEFKEKITKLDKNEEIEDQAESKESESNQQSNELLKQQEFEQELLQISEFKDFGKLTKSTITPIYLTDKDTEIIVTCHKHFFLSTNKLVLQFNITNTATFLLAQNINIVSNSDSDAYAEEFVLAIDELRPNETGIVYACFSMPSEDLITVFSNTLSFTNREIIDKETGEIDESDNGFTDEFLIEDLEILPGDFITPLYNSNFDNIFDQLPYGDSTVIQLKGIKSLENAITKLREELNMLPLDGTEFVPSDSNSHIVKFFGKDIWGGKVGILVRLALTNNKLVAKLQVKVETESFLNTILDGI